MANLALLQQVNGQRWSKMTINTNLVTQIDNVARRLTAPAAMARYEAVNRKTGVPAKIIAVIHERESSQSWKGSLAQGDPWDRVSTHVPSGRGPFDSWEDAAVDALINCPPYASRWKDWSPGGSLTLLEQYNGLGYSNKGRPSPYVWASTNQYASGKYTSDGVYDPNAVDRQLGCAALLKQMNAFAVAPTPPADLTPNPVTAPKTVYELILSFFAAVFKTRFMWR